MTAKKNQIDANSHVTKAMMQGDKEASIQIGERVMRIASEDDTESDVHKPGDQGEVIGNLVVDYNQSVIMKKEAYLVKFDGDNDIFFLMGNKIQKL